jgi:hypothetical protein
MRVALLLAAVVFAGAGWAPVVGVADTPREGQAATEVGELKYKWEVQPGALKWVELNGFSQRKINVTMKASPAGSEVAVAAILKNDLDACKDAMKKGNEPPRYLESHAGADKVVFNFALLPNTPFTVILRNPTDETVTVELTIAAK